MKERKYKEDYALESYIDDRGREKRRAVYQGKWYRLNMDAQTRRQMNVFSILYFAACILFYLIYLKLNSPSSQCMYVLPLAAVTLIPLLYWAMGLVSMMCAPAVMTNLQKENGIGRVMRSSMGCMIFLFIAVVGDVIFMARGADFSAELPGFALLLCAAISALGSFRYIKTRYDAIKEAPKPEGGAQA